jgi:hypothetical protein
VGQRLEVGAIEKLESRTRELALNIGCESVNNRDSMLTPRQ